MVFLSCVKEICLTNDLGHHRGIFCGVSFMCERDMYTYNERLETPQKIRLWCPKSLVICVHVS